MNSRMLVCSKLLLQQRTFQTSTFSLLDWRWRKERGLPNPDSFGPLLTKPDYSFVDGRPVPLSSNLRKRLGKQREYAMKIVQLTREIDFALERHKLMKEEKEQENNKILQRKLTSKGKKEL